jgi:hypothetical protein
MQESSAHSLRSSSQTCVVTNCPFDATLPLFVGGLPTYCISHGRRELEAVSLAQLSKKGVIALISLTISYELERLGLRGFRSD